MVMSPYYDQAISLDKELQEDIFCSCFPEPLKDLGMIAA